MRKLEEGENWIDITNVDYDVATKSAFQNGLALGAIGMFLFCLVLGLYLG